MNTTQLNIHNLGQLWEIAGKASDGFKKDDGYFVSMAEKGEWPNRIWVTETLSEETIANIASEMKTNEPITFSHFNETEIETVLLQEHGFELKSEQYGMSLPLSSKFEVEKTLELERVSSSENAKLWSQAFYDAFQYEISSDTIVKAMEDIPFFLVKNEGTLVGTLILFATDKVLGIHSLGILPTQRKRGYAKEIMHHVLNRAIEDHYDLATLQASEMAKNMYAKMGFTFDFMMKNYRLKQ
ncbi:MAG: GNAT family N-acetyltransferase [Bacteroidota bacterium]